MYPVGKERSVLFNNALDTFHLRLYDIEHMIKDHRDSQRFLSQTEDPSKAGTCARDRRALQLLDLNVHITHSDLP